MTGRDLGPHPIDIQEAHTWCMTPTSAPDKVQAVPSLDGRRTGGSVARPRRGGILARRVTHRRTQLGLSTEELARRAGMDAWFLAYFEQSADTTLSSGGLLRLRLIVLSFDDVCPLGADRWTDLRDQGRAGGHRCLQTLTDSQYKASPFCGQVGRASSSPAGLGLQWRLSGQLHLRPTGCHLSGHPDSMIGNITGIVAFEVETTNGRGHERRVDALLVRGHANLDRRAPTSVDCSSTTSILQPWAEVARLGTSLATGTVRAHRTGHRPTPAIRTGSD